MRAGAIITAAGKSSRMGTFKPLLKIGGITAAERVIHSFHDAGINDIVVITGKNAEDLEKRLSYLNVVFHKNEMYEQNEMLDSIKIGLNHIKDKCDKILITPVDVPLFTSDTVKKLLMSEANVSIPVNSDKTGHPIMINTDAAGEILKYDGYGGLKGAIVSLSMEVEHIEVNDSGILYDMDTQADYSGIVELYNEQFGGEKGRNERAQE